LTGYLNWKERKKLIFGVVKAGFSKTSMRHTQKDNSNSGTHLRMCLKISRKSKKGRRRDFVRSCIVSFAAREAIK